MVSEEGLKVWPSTARGLIKQKVTRCQYAFIPLLLGQGTPAFSCLGFPMQGKAKQKKNTKKETKKSLLWTPFQHSGHHPSPFFPTPKTTHLHLHLQAHICLPTERRLQSHCSSGYLSKKNVLKETPRAQCCSPTPCHGAWPHWQLTGCGEKGFLLVGKVANGCYRKQLFGGKSLLLKHLLLWGNKKHWDRLGHLCPVQGSLGNFSFSSLYLFYVNCRSVSCDQGLCCVISLRNKKMGILSWTLMSSFCRTSNISF